MDDEILSEPLQEISIPGWYLNSLGIRYTLALLFVTLLSWYLIRISANPGKPRQFALLAVVPLPAFVGFVSVFDGLITGLSSMGCGGPKWSEYADVLAMSLVGLQVGLWLTLPGFIVSLAILCRQALSNNGVKS